MSTMNQLGKYQPYPDYKDSGVEWLGEVPTHWFLHALKRSVSGCVNGFWGDEPNGDSDLIVLRVADFDRNKLIISDDKLTYRSISEKERKNRLLKKGDLLIEKSGGGEKTLVGCVVIFDKEYAAVTSNFVAKMTPNPSFHGDFLNYAFNHLYSGRVNYPSIKQTTGIQNLDSESYLMEHFCFPVFSEQRTIAAFLDYETARIDQLIAKQQQLIELLKEKRQAVISHAVTKGLNPNAPMKDSGVEWLGQVPEHWVHNVKLGTVAEQNRGSFVNGPFGSDLLSSELTNEGVPVIYIRDVKPSGYFRKSTDCVTTSKAQQLNVCRVQAGDVLVAKVGTPPGDACVYPVDEPDAIITQDVVRIRVNKQSCNPYYLSHLLNSTYGRSIVDDISVESTRKRFGLGDYKQIKIPLPPLAEQINIAEWIRIHCEKLDELNIKAEKSIALMQERRTALISAAVTGKIDLRGWQPPQSEVAA
ncbi:restriction endonuclease subunit S [Aeromonas caviae]|uniref:restriction endonuclease subunit S n=1 Tax=Aeromonas caviae TaxID=648 RepID=UPI001C1F5C8A|nr:restriction endonuclease subunit S [Aeromonas caviae]